MQQSLLKRSTAELIATFGLVFAGTGAIVVNAATGGTVTHVGIGLTFGLVVAAMILAAGHISGAHINPAVTLAFWSTGRFPAREVPWYVAGQLLGASAASLVILVLIGDHGRLGATLPAGSAAQSLGLEVLLTFFLMFVVMAVATDARANGQMAAIAVGGTVTLEALFAGPISGASMNPARSFGPALVGGHFADHWVYWIGPVAGALLAGRIYDWVRCESEIRRRPVNGRG